MRSVSEEAECHSLRISESNDKSLRGRIVSALFKKRSAFVFVLFIDESVLIIGLFSKGSVCTLPAILFGSAIILSSLFLERLADLTGLCTCFSIL